jgi:fatty-acyl-CoA synthase
MYFDGLTSGVRHSPDAPFFSLQVGRKPAVSISYGEMEERVQASAAMLSDAGVGQGDVVLIFAQHSVGMLQAFFGAQLLGAVPAFMPPPTPRQDLAAWNASHQQLIARIRPALIVSEPACLDQVRALGGATLFDTGAIEAAPTPAIRRSHEVDLDAVAFLQHSSGTTGLKKGVVVTYRQLLAQIDSYKQAIGLRQGESAIVSWLPLYHDMGLIAATLTPFALGAPVKIVDTFSWLADPSVFIDLLVQTPNAFAWLPNFAFAYLAQRGKLPADPAALAHVRAVINCSEPCKAEPMEAFRKRFAAAGLPETAVQTCYAMAEYVFAVTQTQFDAPPRVLSLDSAVLENEHRVCVATETTPQVRNMVSVGRPVAGCEVRIQAADETLVGEVLVRGSSLCDGYRNNPELTAKKFRDGWYATGDYGFFHDGELYITGRGDDLIIVRGKNLYAHDIEEVVSGIEGVKAGRAVAFGVDEAVASTQALVIAAETTDVRDAPTLTNLIREAVTAAFGVSPLDIVLMDLDSLVKTTSGKISRSENSKRYLAGSLASWRKATI